MAQTSAATVVYAVHTWGGRAFPGLLLHEFLRKVDLAAWFLFRCVAKTSLFFSLTVWVFCKQKQLICQQGSVLRSWVPWDRGTASTPQSAGQLLVLLPPGWGQERSTQRALKETALLTRQIFKVFFPIFLCWSRGWCDQWTSEPAAHFFLLVHNSPILSLHSRVLSAVVACPV